VLARALAELEALDLLGAGRAERRDEAREEPDDEVVYYDEPLPTP
jgi:hypothetical protein